MTDNAAAPLEYRLFDLYGCFYTGVHNQIPYGFTGEWRDSTTDRLYLRARYYAPSLASSPDPARLKG